MEMPSLFDEQKYAPVFDNSWHLKKAILENVRGNKVTFTFLESDGIILAVKEG